MEPPLAVPQDRLVPGHLPRSPGAHRPQPAALHGRRTRVPRYHPGTPRRVPGPLLPGRAIVEAVRTQRAPGYPDRDRPGRRAADLGPLLPANPDSESARTLHEPNDGAPERYGHPGPFG